MYIEYMSEITFDHFFISKDELKKKEKKRKNKLELVPVKIINSEWLTYEELDNRIKKMIPSLDESKIKTFLIEPYFMKKNEVYLNYFER